MLFLVKNKEKYLIEIIRKIAPKFSPSSMNLLSVIPIFIASTEMLYLKEEIPAKVSINEAVELSKIFGGDTSKKIVN